MQAEQPRTNSAQSANAIVERSVTLLGATGSVGASTIDLIKREPSRYRVEAVTAHRNATRLATLALELGARFAAISDPQAYAGLKEALSGTSVEVGAGESALTGGSTPNASQVRKITSVGWPAMQGIFVF